MPKFYAVTFAEDTDAYSITATLSSGVCGPNSRQPARSRPGNRQYSQQPACLLHGLRRADVLYAELIVAQFEHLPVVQLSVCVGQLFLQFPYLSLLLDELSLRRFLVRAKLLVLLILQCLNPPVLFSNLFLVNLKLKVLAFALELLILLLQMIDVLIRKVQRRRHPRLAR